MGARQSTAPRRSACVPMLRYLRTRARRVELRPRLDWESHRFEFPRAVPLSGRKADGVAIRVGVDAGGTFTDLIGIDQETGRLILSRRPWAPAQPDRAVLDALDRWAI